MTTHFPGLVRVQEIFKDNKRIIKTRKSKKDKQYSDQSQKDKK